MRVMPEGYLAGFAKLCRDNGLLLIADEVATGFGRTGRMFACELENVKPDLMCVAKSITGGALPLAATLAAEKIYRAFLGRYEEFKTFFHGHTYTANPLACAAAVANLKLYRAEKTLRNLAPKIAALSAWLKKMSSHPRVGAVRQAGFMAGVDVVKKENEPYPVAFRAGHRVCLAARRHGLWARPLGDTLVILPPLSISPAELKAAFRAFERALDEATGGRP
jgi:adenosylmethionine-8-amino-7-oxononanoate aminotransferase